MYVNIRDFANKINHDTTATQHDEHFRCLRFKSSVIQEFILKEN